MKTCATNVKNIQQSLAKEAARTNLESSRPISEDYIRTLKTLYPNFENVISEL